MISTKYNIKLTVPADVNHALKRLAIRDKSNIASKTLELVKFALDFEEDEILLNIANKRETKKIRLITHANAWK